MNVIVFASRKGGSGKSTLAAHLAAHAYRPSRSVLLVDADPQGSLALWHQLRGTGEPPLVSGVDGVREIIASAKRQGYEWVFVDTPPNMSAVVTDAIHAATLIVIPARLTLFDLAAIKETMDLARQLRRPYAIVINGVPPRRDNTESPYVREARAALTSPTCRSGRARSPSATTIRWLWPKARAPRSTIPRPRLPPRLPRCGPPSTSR
jgi:cellulose biosynthesis protein BcsQ